MNSNIFDNDTGDGVDKPEPVIAEEAFLAATPQKQLVLKAELDSAIATAKQYPRSIGTFVRKARDLALHDPNIAGGCFYALPRGNKTIKGPSVRLAEVVLAAYGNIAAEAEIVDQDDKFVYSRGRCRDLENNVTVSVTVRRRITDKHGNLFNDDMIGVTSNAANAVALRNAIFKVVPMVYTNQLLEACMKMAVGEGHAMIDRRDECMKFFSKFAMSQEEVLRMVGKKHLEDLGTEQIETLIGIANALKSGETTIEDLRASFMSEEEKTAADPLAAGDHKPKPKPKAKPKPKPRTKTKEEFTPVPDTAKPSTVNFTGEPKDNWVLVVAQLKNRAKAVNFFSEWAELLVHFGGDLAEGYGLERNTFPSNEEMSIWMTQLQEMSDDQVKGIITGEESETGLFKES